LIRNKTIKFNLDNPEDRKLWEWLQSQPHGRFSDGTKQFWKARMQIDEGTMLEHIKVHMDALNKLKEEQK
jgi:hypothetical protein